MLYNITKTMSLATYDDASKSSLLGEQIVPKKYSTVLPSFEKDKMPVFRNSSQTKEQAVPSTSHSVNSTLFTQNFGDRVIVDRAVFLKCKVFFTITAPADDHTPADGGILTSLLSPQQFWLLGTSRLQSADRNLHPPCSILCQRAAQSVHPSRGGADRRE